MQLNRAKHMVLPILWVSEKRFSSQSDGHTHTWLAHLVNSEPICGFQMVIGVFQLDFLFVMEEKLVWNDKQGA